MHIVENVYIFSPVCFYYVVFFLFLVYSYVVTENIYLLLQRQGGQGQQPAGFSTGNFFLHLRLTFNSEFSISLL
jgi:hypothetical protein